MEKAVICPTVGHPDKICDQVADAIVDEFLRRDKDADVDLDILGSQGMLMIGGRVRSKADFDCSTLATDVYKDIGYEDDVEVFVNIDHKERESDEISHAQPVVVRGYATRETREFLPRPVVFARNIARRIDDLRTTDPAFSWMRPDGSVQLTMDKDETTAVTILLSHAEDIEPKEVQSAILDRIVEPVIGENGVRIFINPDGARTEAGFHRASGVNNRNVSNDTYGGLIPVGDIRLSGVSPNRIERAGAYLTRMAARFLVEQELAESALVTAAYTPGETAPIFLHAQSIGAQAKGTKTDATEVITREFDFSKDALAEQEAFFQPIYHQAAKYGQFGRAGLPWEK